MIQNILVILTIVVAGFFFLRKAFFSLKKKDAHCTEGKCNSCPHCH